MPLRWNFSPAHKAPYTRAGADRLPDYSTRPSPAMDVTSIGSNGSPLDSNDSNATATEWARTPGRLWVTKRVDVVRGLIQRLDLTENLLRALLLGLMGYAVYLAWCEGCKNEYYAFAVALWTAVVDFLSLSQVPQHGKRGVLVGPRPATTGSSGCI